MRTLIFHSTLSGGNGGHAYSINPDFLQSRLSDAAEIEIHPRIDVGFTFDKNSIAEVLSSFSKFQVHGR